MAAGAAPVPASSGLGVSAPLLYGAAPGAGAAAAAAAGVGKSKSKQRRGALSEETGGVLGAGGGGFGAAGMPLHDHTPTAN